MLKLVDIKKDYTVGDTVVHALKGVNLEFREHEFVAILVIPAAARPHS